jgi:RHS repeat-associated protein
VSATKPPLTPAGWVDTVTERIRTGEYTIHASGDLFQANNRAQNMRARWKRGALEIEARQETASRRPGPRSPRDPFFDRQGPVTPAVSIETPGKKPAPVVLRSTAIGRGDLRTALAGGKIALGPCRADGAVDERGQCLRRLERKAGAVTEWWENRSDGVEHGFTIAKPPRRHSEKDDTWLAVEITVKGARVTVEGEEKAVLAREGGKHLTYDGLAAWDAKKNKLAVRMRAAKAGLILEVDDRQARYPVVVDPVLKATPDWQVQDDQASFWAYPLSAGVGDVNGDGIGDFAIGTQAFDTGGGANLDAGKVVVYMGGKDGPHDPWTIESNQPGAHFGAVAETGDLDGDGLADLAVGASEWEDDPVNQLNEGAVFIFLGKNRSTSTQVAEAVASQIIDGDQPNGWDFTIAGAGDIDRDGRADLIITHPGFDNGQTDEGRALVFKGSSSGIETSPCWTFESDVPNGYVYVPDGAGDVNGDGYDDVVLSVPGYNPGGEKGRIYVFFGPLAPACVASGPSPTIPPPQWADGSQLPGSSTNLSWGDVRGAGDVDGDGYADIAIGDPYASGVNPYDGRVYVFRGSANGVNWTNPWTYSSGQNKSLFGMWLSSGDINADGYSDLLVGAPLHKLNPGPSPDWNNPVPEGGAFLFLGSPAGLASAPAWSTFGRQPGDRLGTSVAVTGDVNGDGFGDVLVRSNTGAKHSLFYGAANDLATTPDWTLTGDQGGSGLGATLTHAGDVNGDGYADLLVGSPQFSNGQAGEGRAVLYLGTMNGPATAPAWSREGDQAGASFGAAMAAGDVNGDGYDDAVVLARSYGNGETGEGRGELFLGGASGLAPTPAWTFETNQIGASLSNVAVGDVNGDGYADVLVTSQQFDGGEDEVDEGRAFLFRGSAQGLSTSPIWTGEPNIAGARYGVPAIADVNGDGLGDLVIGSPGQSGGVVYFYPGGSSVPSTASTWTATSGQAASGFGSTIAAIGDVNGDGYADFSVGAPSFTSGTKTGRVFVYQGSPSGPSTPPWTLDSDESGSGFGLALSPAGDVNGDGHGDLLVAAPYYSGVSSSGRVLLYHGSPSGLGNPVWTANGPPSYSGFGMAVASGDFNGDGLSDLTFGAPDYTGATQNGGAVWSYLGNRGGSPVRPKTKRLSGEPVAAGGVAIATDPGFEVALFARGSLGRSRVKLEVEVKSQGTPFDGTGLVRSPQWTDTTTAGVELSQRFVALQPDTSYHYRMRVLYDPTVSSVLRHSRWYYGGRLGEPRGVHVRVRTPQSLCANQPTGTPCDDGNACTTDDVCTAASVCTGTPSPSGTCAIQALAGCVVPRGDTAFDAVFSYRNSTSTNVHVPVGATNSVAPSTAGPPPEWFRPGTNVFSIASGGADVVWTFGTTQTRVTASSTACQVTETPTGTAVVIDGVVHETTVDPIRVAAGGVIAATPDGLGATPGALRVTPDGAATYSVPLWVPPGRAGMEPGLSLSYHSRGGNGLVGVGWSVSGLSQITRCPKNLRNSDTVRAVRFDEDDMFCLDGNPLVRAGGTYGRTGQYRTHIASFAHINSEADDHTVTAPYRMGPARFVVRHKNGRIHTYVRGDALGLPLTVDFLPANYTWLLSRVEDRYGNFMSYSYAPAAPTAPEGTLDIRLTRIRYTGFGTQEGVREVTFEYDERRDPEERYVAKGVRLATTRVLRYIRMSAPNPSTVERIREYRLSYNFNRSEPTSISGRSLLVALQECDGNNTCKPETLFNWELGNMHFAAGQELLGEQSPGTPTPMTDTQGAFSAVDVNNDGHDDLLYNVPYQEPRPGGGIPLYFNRWFYRLWLRDGVYGNAVRITETRQKGDNPWGFGADPIVTDLDGDGSPEAAFWHEDPNVFESTGLYRIHRLDDGSVISVDSLEQDTPGSKGAFVADVNGDGLAELIRMRQGQWQYRPGTGSLTFLSTPYQFFNSSVGGVVGGPRMVDLDGDGAIEMLYTENETDDMGIPIPDVYVTRTSRGPYGPTERVQGPFVSPLTQFDVNGDGLADSLLGSAPEGGRGTVQVIKNGGGRYMPAIFQTDIDPDLARVLGAYGNDRRQDQSRRIVDFDFDGRPDVVSVGRYDDSDTRTTMSVILSRGDRFEQRPLHIQSDQGPAIPFGVEFTHTIPPNGSSTRYGYKGTNLMDVDGDGLDDLVQPEVRDGRLMLVYYRRLGSKPDVLLSVRNGVGSVASVSYAHIGSPLGYYTTSTPRCGLPADRNDQKCVKRGFWVVNFERQDSGIASQPERVVWHNYRDAIRERTPGGHGLVFRTHGTGKMWTAIGIGLFSHRTETTYHVGTWDIVHGPNAAFLAGKPLTTTIFEGGHRTVISNGYQVEQLSHDDGAGGTSTTYWIRQGTSSESYRDAASTSLPTGQVDRETSTSLTYDPDEYGNLHQRFTVVRGRSSVELSRTEETTLYYNNAERWLVGLPADVTTVVTRLQPTAGSVTRRRTAIPDEQTGATRSETIMPGSGPDFEKTAEYTYTEHGLLRSTTVTAAVDGSRRVSRVSTTDYDPVDHAFPVRATNAEGHQAEMVVHPALGKTIWTRDANQAVTTHLHDTFGRQLGSNRPDGTHTTLTYGPGSPARGTATSVTAQVDGHGTTYSEFDRLGREVLTSTLNSAGFWATVGTGYDIWGQVQVTGMPIEETSPGTGERTARSLARPLGATTFTYDDRHRVISTQRPDGATLLAQYFERGRASRDAMGNWAYELFDDRGQTVESGLGDGRARREARLRLSYAVEGQLETSTDARDNVTIWTFDDLGRQTGFAEPNANARTTTFNGFGEVREDRIAGEAVASVSEFDRLGRMVRRTDRDGVTTLVWDAAQNGIGRAARTTSPDGVATTHTYDAAGRMRTDQWRIDGQDYVIDRQYEPSTGRLATLTYPSVSRPGLPAVPTGVTYTYDGATGAVDTIQQAGGDLLFSVIERDEVGRTTRERLGNGTEVGKYFNWLQGNVEELGVWTSTGAAVQVLGYELDLNGNLRERVDRTDQYAPRTERMLYDEQNRLTEWWESTGETPQDYRWKVTYGMDVLGNLTDRRLYLDSGAELAQHVQHDYPTAAGPRPHAVRATSTLIGAQQGFEGAFGYDETRGTQRFRPNGESIQFNTQDLPRSITRGTREVRFAYDAAGARVFKDEGSGPGDRRSTTYVGGLYERRTQPGQPVQHVFYVTVGRRVVAQIVRAETDPTSATVSYPHQDRLGSTVASTSAQGTVLGRSFFDPFGNPYDPAGVPILTSQFNPSVPDVLTGFTGHSMDYDLGLVDMKGRIYDPKVGRFLSTDPVLANPLWDQAYNKYAYVANNPLTMIDPSGFDMNPAETQCALFGECFIPETQCDQNNECFEPHPTEPEIAEIHAQNDASWAALEQHALEYEGKLDALGNDISGQTVSGPKASAVGESKIEFDESSLRIRKPGHSDGLGKDNEKVECGPTSGIKCGSMKDGLTQNDRMALNILTRASFTDEDGKWHRSMHEATLRSKPKIEYGATIHTNFDITVRKGTQKDVDNTNRSYVNNRSQNILTVHTHPNDGHFLSAGDIRHARWFNVPIYMIATDGYVVMYDPVANEIRDIGYLRP